MLSEFHSGQVQLTDTLASILPEESIRLSFPIQRYSKDDQTPGTEHIASRQGFRFQTQRACNNCRKSRMGCSSVKPCTRCVHRRLECSRDPPSIVPKQRFSSVHDQSRTPHQDRRLLHNTQPESSKSSPAITSGPDQPPHSIWPYYIATSAGRGTPQGAHSEYSMHGDTYHNVGPMEATYSAGPDEQVLVNDSRYLLLGQTAATDTSLRSGPEPMFALQMSDGALPARHVVDTCLQHYWQDVHPKFPILHEPSFMTGYERFYSPAVRRHQSGYEENLFRSALWIVCAIAQISNKEWPDDVKMQWTGEAYFRSLRLYCYNPLDADSLAVVQLLLLQTIYLQQGPYLARCGNLVGLAMQVSKRIWPQYAATQDPNQELSEIMQRIWRTCVSLDRQIARSSGSQAMIEYSHRNSLPPLPDDQQGRELESIDSG